MIQYLLRMWPPDLGAFLDYLGPLLETLAMSLIGTTAAFFTAVVLAFPANRSLNSFLPLYLASRTVLAIMRATPILVLGILLVAAVGLGPMAGIIGIWIHTSGVLGKYFSETFETADWDVVDAAYIDGCNKIQVYLKVMLPMESNAVLSYLLYYYEANFRQASFLGIVGAGGVGLYLMSAVGLFDYGRVSILIIMIIGTALILDMISRTVRRKYL